MCSSRRSNRFLERLARARKIISTVSSTAGFACWHLWFSAKLRGRVAFYTAGRLHEQRKNRARRDKELGAIQVPDRTGNEKRPATGRPRIRVDIARTNSVAHLERPEIGVRRRGTIAPAGQRTLLDAELDHRTGRTKRLGALIGVAIARISKLLVWIGKRVVAAVR